MTRVIDGYIIPFVFDLSIPRRHFLSIFLCVFIEFSFIFSKYDARHYSIYCIAIFGISAPKKAKRSPIFPHRHAQSTLGRRFPHLRGRRPVHNRRSSPIRDRRPHSRRSLRFSVPCRSAYPPPKNTATLSVFPHRHLSFPKCGRTPPQSAAQNIAFRRYP